MPAPVLRAIAICLALTAIAAFAEPQTLRNGDDLFLSGLSTTETLAAPRDALAAGATVSLRGSVAADTHATGLDVEVEAATGGSVYAAGATVTQRGTVGQDLNATVRTTLKAVTTGKARLSGVLTIEGPVTGALTASGGEVLLNAAVGGDVVLAAGNLSFGPQAKITGASRYYASAPVMIPANVIAPDRIGALVAGLAMLALLNFIPFLGWIINLTLVLWGLGAMVLLLPRRIAEPTIAPVMSA